MNMRETVKNKAAKREEHAVWPPPPTDQQKPPDASLRRIYLTNYAWLDVVIGGILGVAFNWLFVYAFTNYVLYYLIPHRINFGWNVRISCIISFLASILFWYMLRPYYRKLGSGIFWGCLFLNVLLLWWTLWML